MKIYKLILILSFLTNYSYSQVHLSYEQARKVIELNDERNYLIEKVDLLKKDTTDLRYSIQLKDSQIYQKDELNKYLDVELKSSLTSKKDKELELEKYKNKSRSRNITMLSVIAVLTAILILK